MMNFFFPFFSSPLEPFVVHPFIVWLVTESGLDFSISTVLTTLATLLVTLIYFFLSLLSKKDATLYIVPYRFQVIVEWLHVKLLGLVSENIRGDVSQKYFPLIFYIFTYIAFLNAIGMIPYTFTVTSHLAITFYLSLSFFIGINIIGFRRNGLNMFSLFLPGGTSFALAFLLVPIEFISYVFRPISLSIRLFANMMAGHTLLHVMGIFSFLMMSPEFSAISYLPAWIGVLLIVLEGAVCFIQAYVFSLLICIYLNDALNLH